MLATLTFYPRTCDYDYGLSCWEWKFNATAELERGHKTTKGFIIEISAYQIVGS